MPAWTSRSTASSASFRRGNSSATSASFSLGTTTIPFSASSSTAKSPGRTSTPPTWTGTPTAHGLASSDVPTVDKALLQTAKFPSAQSSPQPATSRIRPSTIAPATPRTLNLVATISPIRATVWPAGCCSNAMEPGAGISVQCLSVGMLLSTGTPFPVSSVPGEELPW
jgi:hypothetical protein